MIEHEIINSEDAGLPPGGYYVDFSNEKIAEIEPIPTETGQQAAEKALEEIRNRSFSGRNPELGKMIKCQFCGLRHHQNERKCEQKFATDENGVEYGKLMPSEGLTGFTARQMLGAQRFAKKRIHPHSNRWAKARANALAAKQRKKMKGDKSGPNILP